jgi:hypothetical protein
MENYGFEGEIEVEEQPQGAPQQGPRTMQEQLAAVLGSIQQEMQSLGNRMARMETAGGAASSSRGFVSAGWGSSTPAIDANAAKLLDLKPPSWSGKGDLERNFILPWKDYLEYTGISGSAPGVVAKIMSSCPPYLQEALRAKRTLMDNQGEVFPTSASGLFALMLKTRPPMDKMRLSLTRMTTNKVNGHKLNEYNQQFLSQLNDLASLTVEQVLSFLYVQGLTGEVRKEVEAKMDWKAESYGAIMDHASQVHSRLRGTHVVKETVGPSPMELGAVGVERQQQGKDLSKVQCYHCKGFGHYKANCPQKKGK